MKNKCIIRIFSLLAFSTSIFAIEGPHGAVVVSDGVSDNGETCVYCHTPHTSTADLPIPTSNQPATPL